MRRTFAAGGGALVGTALLLLAAPASASVRPATDTVYPPGQTCNVSLQVAEGHGSGSFAVKPAQTFHVVGAGWTPLSTVSVTDTTVRPKPKQAAKTTTVAADAQGGFTLTVTYGLDQAGTTHQFTARGTCTTSAGVRDASATASTLVIVSGGQQTRGQNTDTRVLGESITRSAPPGGRATLGPLPFTGSEYALLGVVLAIALISGGSALNRWARRRRHHA